MSDQEQASAEATPAAVQLRLIDADASAEEIAAIVAVFAAASSAPAAPAKAPRSIWADPARRMRGGHQVGPAAWRASGLPH